MDKSHIFCIKENLPESKMVTIAEVKMAPVASLNADSLITVCATLSLTLILLKIGTNVAGSVDEIIEPMSRAVIKGICKI